jgi:CheY-like chemotaxis protein
VTSEAGTRQSLPVLVVDDDEFVRECTQALLEEAGRSVVLAVDGESAIRLCRQQRFACVLLDVRLPRLDCGTILDAIRETDPAVPVYLYTGFERYQLDRALLERPNVGYLEKPLAIDAIPSLGLPLVPSERDD